MDSSLRDWPWRLLNLTLWGFCFAAGLFPETVFRLLRAAAYVKTQNAFVNSPYVITLGLSAYLYLFVRNRSLEAGVDPMRARGYGLQFACLGLLAFLPAEGFVYVFDMHNPVDRYMVIFAAASKLLAWIYLYSVLFRYYAFSGPEVFRRLVSVFPSTYQQERGPRDTPAEDGAYGASEPAAEPDSPVRRP